MKHKNKRSNEIALKHMLILFLIKSGYTKLSATEKVEKALDYVEKITDNPYYTTPVPPLAEITTAANNLMTALNQQDGSIEKTSIKDEKEALLDEKIEVLVPYVQMASGGNKVKIESAGMSVRDAKTPPVLLGPVTEITVKLGKFVGSVDLKWKGFKKSKLYVIEGRNENSPVNEWDVAGETTKSKITITGLESNLTYSFRIVCVSSKGLGPVSEIVTIRVY